MSGARSSSGISITGLQMPVTSRCVGKRTVRPPPSWWSCTPMIRKDSPATCTSTSTRAYNRLLFTGRATVKSHVRCRRRPWAAPFRSTSQALDADGCAETRPRNGDAHNVISTRAPFGDSLCRKANRSSASAGEDVSKRAGITLTIVIAGAAIGAYLAAVNCPNGWWNSADLGSGSARIGSGMLVGAVVATIVRFYIASRIEARDRCHDSA